MTSKEKFEETLDLLERRIIRSMRESKKEWKMPWHTGIPAAINQFTGRFYSGKNLLVLWQKCLDQDYPYNRWATLYQWRKAGAMVKKGAKGTLVVLAIPKKSKVREDNEHLFSDDPSVSKNNDQRSSDFYFVYRHVFNVSQVDHYNIEHPGLFDIPQSDLERLEDFVLKTKAKVNRGGDRAFYNHEEDLIHVPHPSSFIHDSNYSGVQKFNSILLHELVHWTAHEQRCNRPLGKLFGSAEYALEELVAELGAALLIAHFNQKVYPRVEHAAYLNHWLKVLENDFSFFTEALDLARSAIYYLFDLTKILPFDLKNQQNYQLSDARRQDWNRLILT